MAEKIYYDYQVARKSSNIMSFIKQNDKAFSTEEILDKVFNVNNSSNKYPYYKEAVESFLKGNKDFNQVQAGMWYYGSKPVVQPTVISSVEQAYEVSQLLTYVERIKGYIKVSPELAGKTRLKLRKSGKLEIVFQGFKYEFYWRWVYNFCYLFGNGVMDFFADSSLHPQQEFSFKIKENQIDLIIPPQNMVELKLIEHTQLNQIEESMELDKDRSTFPLLYELLSCYPTGLNLKEIYNHFLEFKLVTLYDLKNILKINECFEYDVVEDIWKVKAHKISRYYKDELGNQAENLLSYVWLLGEDISFDAVKDQEEINKPVEKETQIEIYPHAEPKTDDSSEDEEFSLASITSNLNQAFIDPLKIKEEIDSLVIECFNNGDIQALEENYKDAQMIYNYFKNVEQILNKWKGNDL